MQAIEGLDNQGLITEFVRLAKVERLTQTKAARAVGVTQKTASDWWRGTYRTLIPENRKAMEAFVRRRLGAPVDTANGSAPSYFMDRESRAAESRSRAMELDAETRKLEAEASIIRARALELAEANARDRAVREWQPTTESAPVTPIDGDEGERKAG